MQQIQPYSSQVKVYSLLQKQQSSKISFLTVQAHKSCSLKETDLLQAS